MKRPDQRTVTTLALLVGGVVFSLATASVARVDVKVLVELETTLPTHAAVRVGGVDYGLPEDPAAGQEPAVASYSMFQKRLLLALANQEGLLIDLVGVDEVRAFGHFLEDLRQQEHANQSQAALEFGRTEPQDSDRFARYDLRGVLDPEAWAACDYEIDLVVSDWDHDIITNRASLAGQEYAFDTSIESANVTLNLVALDTQRVVYSVYYKASGENLQEAFDEVAADFAVRLEIALWRSWIER
jgi:hypothetical protein